MQRMIIFFLILVLLSGCRTETPQPEDALGTGRLFVRSLLDGELKQAEKLLYRDSSNLLAFEKFRTQYKERLSKQEKEAYKKTDIIIHEFEMLNDSVNLLYYSSGLQKGKKPLRIIRKDGRWQVDFYYTYTGNL